MVRVAFVIAWVPACALVTPLDDLAGSDAALDAASDADYSEVRIPCQSGPCAPQLGELCCLSATATDMCVGPTQSCAGLGTVGCFGTLQCLAIGKTTCCATVDGGELTGTACTDLSTCIATSNVVLCDRPDGSPTGDPSDTRCPSPLACTGSTKLYANTFRTCQ